MLGGSRDGWVVIGGWKRFAEAQVVWKCEGVPDALALAKHLPAGHIAFTNICGCQSMPAELPDFGWKELRVIGDSDEPGQAGARKFAERVAKVQKPSAIKLLPALHEVTPSHALDLRDFFKEGGTLERLEALAANAERVDCRQVDADGLESGEPVDDAPLANLEFRPFPTHELPSPVREFVQTAAAALGCCESFIALPLLTGCAAAIGNSRRLLVKPGWTEPCVIWGAIIGYSGEHKSPALDAALGSLREHQNRAIRQYQAALREHDQNALPRFKAAEAAFSKGKGSLEPPVRPEPPVCERWISNDCTIEGLAALLEENPRGLLLDAEELASWLGSFERYSATSDVPKWLSLFGGRSLTIDRKTGQRVTYVAHAAVSVCGGIQPAIWQRSLTTEFRENGLAARILVTMPPRSTKRWTDNAIPETATQAIAEMTSRLLALEMEPAKEEFDDPKPVLLRLDGQAFDLFKVFYNEHAHEQRQLDGEMASTWAKLEGYALRLAIVLHCIRYSNGEILPELDLLIDAETMRSAIAVTRWFAREALRIREVMTESEGQREQRELVDWIKVRGGRITPRNLARKNRKYRGPVADADAVLSELVKAGHGQWVMNAASSGPPTRTFELIETRCPQVDLKQTASGELVDKPHGGKPEIALGTRFVTDDEREVIDGSFD